MNAVHRLALALSGGRLGWRLSGMPALRLTTIGRRSGLQRTVMLTSPLRVGDAVVVVASRGGDDRHPDWFLNLRVHPDVEVALGHGLSESLIAREATAAERAVLWPQIVSSQPRYGGYQSRTGRDIPVVLLEPRASG